MRFPRPVALLLIVGLMISSCSFGSSYPLSESPSQKPVANDQPPSRNDLTGLSGGEQNIDPFTVNPINRWDSSSSGPLTTGITNGELSLETYLNDSTDSYYFRESSTADDTISIRWRLNQTADGEFADLDFAGYGSMLGRAMNDKDYGTDGWGWAEGAAETDQNTYTDGTVSYLGGAIRVVSAFGVDDGLEWGASFRYLAFSFNTTINGTKYTSFEIRTKVEKIAGGANLDEEVFIAWWDASNNKVWESATNVTNAYQTFTHTAAVNWTGNKDAILVFLKTADGNQDDWTSGALEVAQWSIDYLRLSNPVNADEIQGDFAVPLCGLNATTSEGTANTTLTAYQWNSSHYTIRSTMTTADGSNSRSWNLDSDYQDYAQSEGTSGADGWDFTEGGWDNVYYQDADDGVEFGYYYCTGRDFGLAFYDSGFGAVVDIDASDYGFFVVKARVNESTTDTRMIVRDTDLDYVYKLINITTDWQIFEFNISDYDAEVGTFDSSKIYRMYLWDSEFPSIMAYFDYARMLTTTTDDREFFEYNKYYRAELDYDLRSSQLEFELQDDLGDDLVKEEIGDFTIADYFDSWNLIPDIFLGEVGFIDYLLGVRTAGSNGTCWWDYYQAEFQEHSFKVHDSLTSAGDPPGSYARINSTDAFSLFATVNGSSGVWIKYRLTVPEFDSVSGSISIASNNSVAAVDSYTIIRLYSVAAADGSLTEELEFGLEGPSANQYNAFVEADQTYRFSKKASTTAYFGKAGFSVYFNKQERTLGLQMVYEDATEVERRHSASAIVASTQSNEYVIEIAYDASHTTGGVSEVRCLVDQWTLTFRDLFGIPTPKLPNIFGGAGDLLSAGLNFLLAPLIAILNVIGLLPDLIGEVLGTLGNVITQLTSIEGILGLIDDAVGGVTSAIGTLETALGGMVDGFGDVVDAAMGVISDAIDGFTDAIGVLAAQIWTAVTEGIGTLIDALIAITGDITDGVVSFVRDIGVGGTTIGDVLDLVGNILNFFVATVADTLEFTAMIMVTWGTLLMVFIFIAIIFFAIMSADHAGQVPGKIYTSFSMNILPISVWGFKIHVPLVVMVVPFLVIVALGIV